MRRNHGWMLTFVLLVTEVAYGTPYLPAEPRHNVETLKENWKDRDRSREIPVLICYPADLAQFSVRAPVIVFSHGLGGTRETYKEYGQQWAANGYVIIFPQHHGSDSGVIGHGMREMLMGEGDLQAFVDRVKDIHFLIDHLEQLNAGKLGADHEIFAGHLDLNRIGMAGHSFGAITTQAIAGQQYSSAGEKTGSIADPRVKAGIVMSGGGSKDRDQSRAFGSIKIPLFYLTGTEDKMGNIGAGERRTAFDFSTEPDTFLLTFTGANHMTFVPRVRMIDTAGKEKFVRLVQETTTAFWDAYLKDDAPAKTWFKTNLPAEVGALGVFEQKHVIDSTRQPK